MAPRATSRTARKKTRRSDSGVPVRKKSRYLEGVKRIRLDDFELLRKFLTEHGKIIPSRISGLSAAQQRRIRTGIRRARVMGLLP